MSTLLEVSERFIGSNYELHLSPAGLALTHHGVTPADPRFQSATYPEVAGVAWEPRRRTLSLALGGERPMWVIRGLFPAEGAWAEVLLREATLRWRLLQEPGFHAPLPPAALQTTVDHLVAVQPPQAGILADFLLTQAALRRATDLHLQSGAHKASVRLRIDGSLRTVATLPGEAAQRVVARLKVQGRMKTYAHAIAQTGSAALTVAGRRVDLRLTVLPTSHGEKLTVRLFDPAQALLDLAGLGMPAPLHTAFCACLERPQGTLLLTGPSGSGKTTTLYASLAYLQARNPDRSLAGVEEPVELDLEGVDQTAVNRAVGLDFAEGLRNVLRQDPQVIMVGEIRDAETAHIAVQAGLTGHLVLSTVHAPSAAGVFARLTQIGVEPYLVASSVTAVLAQRLVRQVCRQCGGPESGGTGCEQCGRTGYYGRTGLFALLPVSRAMREAVLACRPLPELEDLAAQESLGDLWEAGREKVDAGITTLAELERVLGRREAG